MLGWLGCLKKMENQFVVSQLDDLWQRRRDSRFTMQLRKLRASLHWWTPTDTRLQRIAQDNVLFWFCIVMHIEHQLIVLCSESKYREVSSNWSSLELTHSAPTGRPGTLLPSRGPTKYLINGRNCDTISNEPFIEPHLDNPEIGIQASGGVPNQRIPARQRSCITNTIYLQLQRQHICHLSKLSEITRVVPRQAWSFESRGAPAAPPPSPPWHALCCTARHSPTKPPTSYASSDPSGSLS